ncbi:hydroxyacid dehydrogenase [Leifsonia bigeumensis]|uniref:Hydroxyacid dehydrogenase n=1 Tax=Leifsonella bigeumensis TaxID=433643 RepID=A0ABP7F5S0_9MICO
MAELTAPRVLALVAEKLQPRFFDQPTLDRLAKASGGSRPSGLLFRGSLPAVGPDIDLSAVEVLITDWGTPPLDAVTLDRFPALKLVAHTGASVKSFVTDELFRRGILVTQAGDAMARPVAEVSLAFTLALLHQLPRFDHAMHDRADWALAEQAPPQHEIDGATIGIVGASRTGRAYLRLVQSLGARTLIYDPTLDADDAHALDTELVGLDALLSHSRIVALHAPSLPGTYRMLSAEQFALMQDGAGLVNTARSWLVDPAALLAELQSGRIDAAIDVFDDEPLPTDSPLRLLPNVLLTPHRAAGTFEGHLRQGGIVVDEIEAFFGGKPLKHTVGPKDLNRMA